MVKVGLARVQPIKRDCVSERPINMLFAWPKKRLKMLPGIVFILPWKPITPTRFGNIGVQFMARTKVNFLQLLMAIPLKKELQMFFRRLFKKILDPTIQTKSMI